MNNKELKEFYAETAPGVTDLHHDINFMDFSKSPKSVVMHHLIRIMNCGYLAVHYLNAATEPVNVNWLDVGSGHGELYNVLQNIRLAKGSKYTYTAIDLDKRKEEIFRLMHPRTQHQFIVHDLRKGIPMIPSESKNAVVMTEVLEHVSLEEGNFLLNELYRVTEFGGVVILTTPDHKNYRGVSPYHVHEWNSKDLQLTLESIGFDVVKKFWYLVPWKDIPSVTRNEVADIIDPEFVRSALSPISTAGTGGIVCFILTKLDAAGAW